MKREDSFEGIFEVRNVFSRTTVCIDLILDPWSWIIGIDLHKLNLLVVSSHQFSSETPLRIFLILSWSYYTMIFQKSHGGLSEKILLDYRGLNLKKIQGLPKNLPVCCHIFKNIELYVIQLISLNVFENLRIFSPVIILKNTSKIDHSIFQIYFQALKCLSIILCSRSTV